MKYRGFCTKKYTITIGIVGADKEVGVTHLSIMLANFLASKQKRRVAAVDFSQERSFEELSRLYGEEMYKSRENLCFRMHQVDYYSIEVSVDIARLLQWGYEYVVIDFGTMRESIQEEVRRCHIRILVGNCSEWKKKPLMHSITRWILSEKEFKWQIAAFMGIDTVKTQIEHQFGIHIQRIPYEEDPFVLHKSHFESLNSLLQEAEQCL